MQKAAARVPAVLRHERPGAPHAEPLPVRPGVRVDAASTWSRCALQGLAELTKLVPAGTRRVAVRGLGHRARHARRRCSSAGATPTCSSSVTPAASRRASARSPRCGPRRSPGTPSRSRSISTGSPSASSRSSSSAGTRTCGDAVVAAHARCSASSAAFGMMMRAQEALWLLLPGVEALWHVVVARARAAALVRRRASVLHAAALVAFSPQMLVWCYYTGSPLQPAQVEPLRPTTPFIVVALFSTRGGLFPWSPIAYAALARAVASPARARRLALALPGRVRARGLRRRVGVGGLRRLRLRRAPPLRRRGADGAGRRPVVGALRGGARRSGAAAAAPAGGRLPAWPRGRRVRALCIVLNLAAMELLRAGKIASSGAYARSAERFLTDVALRAPRPPLRRRRLSVRAAGRLAVRAGAPRAGVGVRGHRRQLVPRSRRPVVPGVVARCARSTTARALTSSAGLALGRPKTPARVTGPIRLLLPMFAAEPIVVHLVGRVPPGAASGGVERPRRPACRRAQGRAPERARRGGARRGQRAEAGAARRHYARSPRLRVDHRLVASSLTPSGGTFPSPLVERALATSPIFLNDRS